MPSARPLRDRLHTLVNKAGAGGCWLWTLKPNRDGYGVIATSRTSKRLAHRAMYEIEVGPIPDGLELDHLCRVRHCCNPEHLEAVTHHVNTMRGKGSRQTCRNGHPWNAENTHWKHRPGRTMHRDCRACERHRTTPTCKKGHAWTAENTHQAADGRRQCIACRPPRRR